MKTIKKVFLSLLPPAFLALPLAVSAQTTCTGNCVQNGLNGVRSIFPQTGLAGSIGLTGPLGLIANVIGLLLTVSGAIAVVFVIIGGFWYITSAGNSEQAEKGQKTLTNAIIGVIIVILAYVIINVVSNFVTGTGGFFG